MEVYEYSNQTSTDTALLTYDIPSGTSITVAGKALLPTDTLQIPLVVTTLNGITRKANPITVTVLPGIDLDPGTPIGKGGGAFGGVIASEGTQVLPRMVVEGTIDTPMVLEARAGFTSVADDPFPYSVPDFIVNDTRQHYAKFIIACLEGRAPVNTVNGRSTGWKRWDPKTFRDSYGREYNRPKVSDFTATYVEGAPGRTNFTLELIV